jgi:type I restriction enzyme R subunit
LDVFGEVIDSYTMTESVKDEITVRIVNEGRAAKVVLNNSKVTEIEAYYATCADAGSNELQIEESKKATNNINSISGDPDRSRVLAANFVEHYDTRVKEGSIVCGKDMFCVVHEISPTLYIKKLQCCALSGLRSKSQMKPSNIVTQTNSRPLKRANWIKLLSA